MSLAKPTVTPDYLIVSIPVLCTLTYFNCFLCLGLTVCVLSILFLFDHCIIIDLSVSPVMIKEASTRAEHNLCFDNSRVLGEYLVSKMHLSPRPAQWLRLLYVLRRWFCCC